VASTDVLLPKLVALPGGIFVMGNDNGRPDERPAHRVRVDAFRAAAAPVSNREYGAFLRGTGRHEPRFWSDPRFDLPEAPVVGITWFDAMDYCRWLNRETGTPFRLPTEAEREYACLGGLTGADWPWGSDAPSDRPELAEIAVLERTHVPTDVCANGFGLLCMADNVHEWCSDWYDATYYGRSPEESPAGPASGKRRASRGGAWRHQIKFNRCSARSSLDPAFEYNDYGFRVYADA
jgi:formylglycine-generating enzyme required for sulfatase activity